MTEIAEQLFERTQVLNQEERMALAEKLIESVSSEEEILAAHVAVARRRLREIQAGEVKPVSREDTLTRVREALNRKSPA